MKVSIITATYNSASTLESCMESVLNQTYGNIEYLIIDGNSKDKTLEIIQKANKIYPEIKWISEADKGIYDALNKGVAMASGEIIGFVHSDDFLASKYTVAEVVAMFKKKSIDGTYGDLQYIDPTSRSRVIRNWKSKQYHPRLLKRGWMPAHPTLFLKKAVYKKHGNFNMKYKIASDYDFMLRILLDESLRFSYLPKVLVKMRVGGISNRNLASIYKKSQEDYSVIRRNGLRYPFIVLLMKNISKVQQFLPLV